MPITLLNNCIYDAPSTAGQTFADATPWGDITYSFPIMEDKGIILGKQRYIQALSVWAPLPFNTPGPTINGRPSYLVEETELEDVGAGLSAWYRIFASFPVYPGGFTNPFDAIYLRAQLIVIQRTYKYLFKTLASVGGAVVAAQVQSQTRPVQGTAYWYYLTNPNLIHDRDGLHIPDVSVVNFSMGTPSFIIERTGGFPSHIVSEFVESNEGDANTGNPLIHMESDVWMGAIYYLKLIYAP